MSRLQVHIKRFIDISDELKTFIKMCFSKGGSLVLQINDIAEWAVDDNLSLLEECDKLLKEHGEFYIFRNKL